MNAWEHLLKLIDVTFSSFIGDTNDSGHAKGRPNAILEVELFVYRVFLI